MRHLPGRFDNSGGGNSDGGNSGRDSPARDSPARDSSRRRGRGISRRGVLAAVGAGLGGWAEALFVPTPSLASPGRAVVPPVGRAVLVPRTLARTSVGAGPASVGFDIGYVGVRWAAPGSVDGGAAGAAIRLRWPGRGFGPWTPLPPGCPCNLDHPAGAPHEIPTVASMGEAEGVSPGVPTGEAAAGRAARATHGVLAVGHGASGYELRMPADASEVASVAINTTAGPPRRLAAPVGPAGPAAPLVPVPLPADLHLEYLPRAAWGADESLRLPPGTDGWQPAYHPGQAVTVHHTVTPNDDPDPAATMRAIYHFHTVDRGWSDIGYHLLIDEAGRLYEGRWSGTDGIPGHRANGDVVTGAHVGGYNSGNVGVALLGDYRTRSPTAAARRTLVLVLLALTGAHKLDPLGTVDYVNPDGGARRRVPTISGHRDWMATECPGGSLYGSLPGIRTDAARLLL